MKCSDAVCQNQIDSDLACIHPDTGSRYCLACAHALNRENNRTVVLVPTLDTSKPNTQQQPRPKK